MVRLKSVLMGGIYPICIVSVVAILSLCSVCGAEVPTKEAIAGEVKEAIQAELAEPFCFFRDPNDVLGFKDCPEGTQVTHDGAFHTGFGELDLFAGVPLSPVNKRVKTLLGGYLPAIEYSFVRDNVEYRVQAFAAPLDLNPRNNLINFIRITAMNRTDSPQETALGVAFVRPHGNTRLSLPCQQWYRDRFMDADAFESASESPAVSNGRAMWKGHLVFTYPQDSVIDKRPAVAKNGAGVTYHFVLNPHKTRSFDFKLPYVPVHADRDSEVSTLIQASHDSYLAKTVKFWERILKTATVIDVPDEKAVNTMKSSLIYDLIARDITEDGKQFIQKVNEFQYDSFYPRDSAYFVRTYDLIGLHDVARETLQKFIVRDSEGKPISLLRMMPDDWGQSLWAVGAHFRSTGDTEFAREIYPAIAPHIERFKKACAGDTLGLWPAAGPYDNEAIDGHYTGHSFWALLGLREAANLANAVGREDDAKAVQALHDEYRDKFMSHLKAITARTAGYIPPGIDNPVEGCDWANASAGVYPFGVIDADDPMVTATIDLVRDYKYREGIMTYGPNAWALKQQIGRNAPPQPGWLHHYETFYLLETMLACGRQREVIEDFYSILAHTGSTNSGFEFSIRPWGDRTFGWNSPPHGWFAAKYISLMRNMLLREEGDTLHLASALSPQWITPGETISVKNGDTYFGPIDWRMTMGKGEATVQIKSDWRQAPDSILFHIPWFLNVNSATVDGEPVTPVDGAIKLSPDAKELALNWSWKEQPRLSYERAVAILVAKYHNMQDGDDRYFLFPAPRRPQVRNPGNVFVDSLDVELFIPGNIGAIRYTLDGTPAHEASTRYTKPIRLTETTTIKAVTTWDDGRVSQPLEVTFRKASLRKADDLEGRSPGLHYSYHEGEWPRLPDFQKLTPQRQGETTALGLKETGHRPNHFAVKFDGFIEIPADGVYTFYLASHDASRLVIGSNVVVEHNGMLAVLEERGDIALSKGPHPISVMFLDKGATERLSVSYSGPGVQKQEISASVLFRQE